MSRRANQAHPRLIVLATHVIQYQAPLWRRLAERANLDLLVGYFSSDGLRPYTDPGFATEVKWDSDLTAGYNHEVVPNAAIPSVRAAVAVQSWLRRKPADAVLVHGHYDVRMRWAARAPRRPYAVVMRGESSRFGASSGVRSLLRDRIVRSTLRRVDAAVAIGTSNTDFYEYFGLPSSKIFWSPYCVDNESFRLAEGERSHRGEPLTALFCGKLIERKRPLDLFDARDQMTHPLRIVICGDGPLREEVKRRLRPGDEFLGFVNQRGLRDVHRRCDLLVLPSSFETWGLVVNEGMAAGLIPVVSSSIGCAPDLAAGIGEIFPVGDTRALATALDRLTRSDIEGRSVAALERVATFDLDAAAEGIEAAVAAVVGPGRTAAIR